MKIESNAARLRDGRGEPRPLGVAISGRRLLLAAASAACVVLLTAAQARADFYNCYQAGNCPSPALSNDPACVRNTDYSVTVSDVGSHVTVLSHHGGFIELNTSAISSALASRYGWNRYDFYADGSPSCLDGLGNSKKFHITSTNFDEPSAVALVGKYPKAVAIHGYSNETRGYPPGVICVGGRDAAARSAFISHVSSNAASWGMYALEPADATAPDATKCSDLPGESTSNIVNRTSSGAGLQLELHKDMRADLVNTSSSYNALRDIIYGAVQRALGDPSRYGFESSVQGWQPSGGAITSVSGSATRSFFGQRSLAVSILAQVDTQKAFVLSPGVAPGTTITYRVWLGTQGGVSAIQPFVKENATGGWRWTGNYKSVGQLTLGQWNELKVTVPADAAPLHSLGVEFFSNGSAATTAYVDSVDW